MAGENVCRMPQSILKQPSVTLHSDVTPVHTAVPVVAPATLGSLSVAGTSINAKSLHLPPGADLNDVISEMFKPQPVVAVQQTATPVRKSSLVSPRSGPSPSVDVTRSTSLRQPTRSEWPPLRHGFISTQLNLSAMPSPVDAVFQHISFASPMTVTSNPVHSASGAAAVSSAQMSPPAYHPPPAYNSATNVEQPTFSAVPQLQPQHSDYISATPIERPQHNLLWPSSLSAQSHSVSGDRRTYFDSLVTESLPNSAVQLQSAANNVYRLAPVPLVETGESGPADSASPNHEASQTASFGVAKLVEPPSYQAAKSRNMKALNLTPPSTERYFDDIERSQQTRFPVQLTNESYSIAASIGLTNGDANRTYVTTPLLTTNGRHEPVVNGPTTYLRTPHTNPVGMAVTHSASAPVNRHVSFCLVVLSVVHCWQLCVSYSVLPLYIMCVFDFLLLASSHLAVNCIVHYYHSILFSSFDYTLLFPFLLNAKTMTI